MGRGFRVQGLRLMVGVVGPGFRLGMFWRSAIFFSKPWKNILAFCIKDCRI